MSLELLRRTEFDWVTRQEDVWGPLPEKTHFVHEAVLQDLMAETERLGPGSPACLGRVVTGQAGAGKTHLLRHLRREVRDQNGFFFLVDCTDIRDFWPTLMLGIVAGLMQESHEGWSQAAFLRYGLTYTQFATPTEAAEEIFSEEQPTELLRERVAAIVRGLPSRVSMGLPMSQVAQALLLLSIPDPIGREAAGLWLQGFAIEEPMALALGLPPTAPGPVLLVKALTRLCAQIGPVVLAFDQMDALISQYHYQSGPERGPESEEAIRARAILHGMGTGLMGLFDHASRTLMVLACLHENWKLLGEQMGTAAVDRFREPVAELRFEPDPERPRRVAQSRLEAAAATFGLDRKTIPVIFDEAFYQRHAAVTPRVLLQACDAHRRRCLASGRLLGEEEGEQEALRLEPDDLDQLFEEACAGIEVAKTLGEENEDGLGASVCRMLALLRYELSLPEGVDFAVDHHFSGGRQTFPTLHARLRLIFRNEKDREAHLCVRVLQRRHHAAFRGRLHAAMVEAGIDQALPYRRLVLFRGEAPGFGGEVTRRAIAQFEERGGRFLMIREADVRRLKVLLQWRQTQPNGFEAWLARSRPISTSETWGPLVALLWEAAGGEFAGLSVKKTEPERKGPQPVARKSNVSGQILLGLRVAPVGGESAVHLPLSDLTRHVMIRAGSGGGKTVLLKRLIEEAALAGVSSVVLDPGNDLAQLAMDWPEPPEGWMPGDDKRLVDLRKQVEVTIYTPGRSDGRPLSFPFLPDLTAVVDEPDELNQTIESAVESLALLIAPGGGTTAQHKRGILAAALRLLATKTERSTAGDLAALLESLPPGVDPGVPRAARLAADLSGSLRALMAQRPEVNSTTHLADWASLFGVGVGHARVSVINFSAMSGVAAQQEFVNRLAVSLFAWAKKHPSAGATGVTGLFVLDEARDFLPSTSGSPCKKSLLRLAAQARKYGLGLMLATQNPKDVDYNAVAQFSTQYFGRAQSPQVISFIQQLLTARGATMANPSRLARGEFYLVTGDGASVPERVKVPLCLTAHPDSQPLSEEQLLTVARRGVALGVKNKRSARHFLR